MQTDEIEKLLAEATPGPWEWVDAHSGGYHHLIRWVAGETFPNGDQRYEMVHSDGSACGEYGADIDVDGADARLIAMAPDLAAEVVRLRNALEKIRDRSDQMIWGEDHEIAAAMRDMEECARAALEGRT